MAVKVTGGAYEEREGIVARLVGENIVVRVWYDGGCSLDISINMPLDEFLKRLKQTEETDQ